MSADLFPCAHCGGACQLSNGHASEQVWPHGDFYRVFCAVCQTRQLFHRTSAEAIAAWNRRAPVQAQGVAQLSGNSGGLTEQKPVAWAAFADNGNIRIWTSAPDDVRKLAESVGMELVPLYCCAQPVSAEDKRDAERWRAMLGSARIRIIGSAGIKQDTTPDGEPYNNYAHFGMEIWTKYGTSLDAEQTARMQEGNAYGREVLAKYADIAIAALTKEAK